MRRLVNYGAANTGLVGTVGFTIYDEAGAVAQARTTAGVFELGSSGTYGVNLTKVKTWAFIVWDRGVGVDPASEELTIEENNLYLRRRNESNSDTNKQTQYDEAGGVYAEADIYEDHDAVTPYVGGGIARRGDYA